MHHRSIACVCTNWLAEPTGRRRRVPGALSSCHRPLTPRLVFPAAVGKGARQLPEENTSRRFSPRAHRGGIECNGHRLSVNAAEKYTGNAGVPCKASQRRDGTTGRDAVEEEGVELTAPWKMGRDHLEILLRAFDPPTAKGWSHRVESKVLTELTVFTCEGETGSVNITELSPSIR
ncbi:hypothetical protein EYF80_010595 [Liparis tanakae]|uniref:Uncharacterized protein n=1 Tax=Liparis tanakae TaxID=230148 RepID=A0A4Z2IMZ7_9TELE|nr:hypothetical protein EYF80_010595 [Liparis tanakae]